MERVLIFGVSGFVGKYLCKEFINNGYEVIGSDKVQNNNIEKSIKFVVADLLNKDEVKDVINRIRPNIVINLAAISSVGISWKNPQQTMQVNIIGALNILEASRKSEFKPRILFIGSSEEYMSKSYPIDEKSELNASNPYGISKVTQENIADLYRKEYGLKVFCVRAFNHTGVGQRDSFVLPSFCKQIVEIEKSGKDGVIRVGNLNVKRDFSHVKDIVRAYRMIVESDDCNIIYNVGSGKTYSLKEMIEYIISKSKQKISIEVDKDRIRPNDEPVICCNHNLITTQLNWKPKYTVFDAIDEMIEYYRKCLGVY